MLFSNWFIRVTSNPRNVIYMMSICTYKFKVILLLNYNVAISSSPSSFSNFPPPPFFIFFIFCISVLIRSGCWLPLTSARFVGCSAERFNENHAPTSVSWWVTSFSVYPSFVLRRVSGCGSSCSRRCLAGFLKCATLLVDN